MNLHQLRWARHTLSESDHRLPRQLLFTGVEESRKKARCGEIKTNHHSMKLLILDLSHVVKWMLPGWDARDNGDQ